MGSIKNVVTEPIEGHEDYYMMVRGLAAADMLWAGLTCLYLLFFMNIYITKTHKRQFAFLKQLKTTFVRRSDSEDLEHREGKTGSRAENSRLS